jgi:hypothetical protein
MVRDVQSLRSRGNPGMSAGRQFVAGLFQTEAREQPLTAKDAKDAKDAKESEAERWRDHR